MAPALPAKEDLAGQAERAFVVDSVTENQRPEEPSRGNGHWPDTPPAAYPTDRNEAVEHANGWTSRHDRTGRLASPQEHEPVRPEVRGEIGPLIDDLRALFERDRATASQSGATRCGMCYLHFPQGELEYRDAEGFYVCARCAQALGKAAVFMVRRQQR